MTIAILQQDILQGPLAELTDLADVVLTGLVDGDRLEYDSGSGDWINVPSGTLPAGSVSFSEFQDINSDRLIGRDTAGVGSVAEISLGASLEFSGADSIQRAALTGDVTAAANSNTTAIANNAVTYAKFQDIATNSLVGRDTGGSGDPESILLNSTLEFDGSLNLQRAALTGDVTASAGSNTTAIANDAVTFAKFQNISSDRLVGRDTALAGDTEEISLGVSLEFSGAQSIQRAALTGDVTAAANSNSTTIANDAVTFAKMLNATAESVIIGRGQGSGAGDFQELTLGTGLSMTGTVLSSTGGAADEISVNATDATNANFSTLPAAPAGGYNVIWQINTATSPDNVSAYVDTSDIIDQGLISKYVFVDVGGTEAVVADHVLQTVQGNARGANAVDLQTERSAAAEVAGGANSVIGGGENNKIATTVSHGFIGGGLSNELAGATHFRGVIVGGNDNIINNSTDSTIGGGASHTIAAGADGCTISGGGGNTCNTNKDFGTIPGGASAVTRRFGELAYAGAVNETLSSQLSLNVLRVTTTDATATEMGYAVGSLDAASIPFPATGQYMLTFRGTVCGARTDDAATAVAAAFEFYGAVKKDFAGTVSFVGTPVVTVLGRDDSALACALTLAAANAGVSIKVTGLAAKTFKWCGQWQGSEVSL